MTKVTYLFGAGASAGTNKRPGLPIVDELPWRIIELILEIKNKNLWLPDDEDFKDISGKSKKDCQMKLIEDLEWVSVEAGKHASVDTFAKKLFLRGDEEKENLKRLKIALSVFFILEQARKPVDVRYDAFFASILNETPFNLPEHIRIISWNYDYQFEKAYSGFSDKHDISESWYHLNVITKFYREHEGLPGNHFSIVKLNGTTGFFDGNKHFYYLRDSSAQFDLKTMSNVVEAFAKLDLDKKNNLYPSLSFAWETRERGQYNIVDDAIACSEDAEILVVVGYSFPFFNREVDRKIIGSMTNLRKVYFQAPAPWHEKIRTRFQAIRQDINPENLIAYDEVESFLLPDELEL
jgi:hypothetical protein